MSLMSTSPTGYEISSRCGLPKDMANNDRRTIRYSTNLTKEISKSYGTESWEITQETMVAASYSTSRTENQYEQKDQKPQEQ